VRMIEQPSIPNFSSEAEEAEWWYANREWLTQEFLQAAKEGRLKRGSPRRGAGTTEGGVMRYAVFEPALPSPAAIGPERFAHVVRNGYRVDFSGPGSPLTSPPPRWEPVGGHCT
jgi:hypothetical protein